MFSSYIVNHEPDKLLQFYVAHSDTRVEWTNDLRDATILTPSDAKDRLVFVKLFNHPRAKIVPDSTARVLVASVRVAVILEETGVRETFNVPWDPDEKVVRETALERFASHRGGRQMVSDAYVILL